MDYIQNNIAAIRENIEKTAKKAGRDPKEITLVAVSKTVGVNEIKKAYEAGIRDFGENRVQEILAKKPELPEDIRWHLIGHLQKNKVKHIVGETCLIHSVDSYPLAEAIQKKAEQNHKVADILLEINIAKEETKFGIFAEEAPEFIEKISCLPNIRLNGYMCVAPFVENSEENRKYFRKMHQILVDSNNKNMNNNTMCILSMGMSNDYTIAIEEGATIIRIGTDIFGERSYI